MLSVYIKNRQASVDLYNGTISLCHTSQPLTIDALPEQYLKITRLTLNYCGLASLDGIQQFQSLEELSVKFNRIEEVEELHKIGNKEGIKKLDFSGNDVEYLGGAMFINLRKEFTSLVDLNAKNYMSFLVNRKGKGYPMKTVLKKVNNIEKQMKKTVKVSSRHHHPYAGKGRKQAIEETCQKGRQHRHQLEVQQDVSEETERYQEYESSRQRCKSQLDEEETSREYSSQREEEPQYQELGLRENRNFNNVYTDVSMGAISEIPMTKSIRGSRLSQFPQKKKGLAIKITANESMEAHQEALMQPTATFANQRAKESVAGQNFMFKTKNQHKYMVGESMIEPLMINSRVSQKRQTKREFNEEQYMLRSMDSEEDRSCIGRSLKQTKDRRYQLAVLFHEKTLIERCYPIVLREFMKNRNMPKKASFG